jgi:hypothetical protein
LRNPWESQVNGRIGSPSVVSSNGDNLWVLPAQPGNERSKQSNIYLFPTEMLIAKIFPEQL